MSRIYLDYNASTPLHPLVRDAMQRAIRESEGTAMIRVRTLRDELWAALRERFGDRIVLNGHPEQRLPNTLNVSFVGRVGADILGALDGVAASTGSACHSGRARLSAVLAAMRISPEVGMGAVRFSLGRETRADELSAVIERLALVSPATDRFTDFHAN